MNLDVLIMGFLQLTGTALLYLALRPKKQAKNGAYAVMDTSTIIDGRIIDVAKGGFLPGKVLVPKFVIAEMQLLADGRDAHKRERARFGLDVVAALQQEVPGGVVISDHDYKELKFTDDKLVRLCEDKGYYLCTNDFNLNKVAVVHGVRVLNINQLSQDLRPPVLPGEAIEIKIVQKGSNKDQGVGYLDDGTMVVVAGAGRMIGKKVSVSVTRMLQTEAGKMIFSKLGSRN